MKFLLYGLNFSPELTGIGKYSGEMAQWLVEHGHDVDVVTAPPYYPEWKLAAGYSGRWFRVQKYGHHSNELRITRCPLWVPRRVTGGTRIIHLASFAFSSLFALSFSLLRRPDIVFLVVPTLACAPAVVFFGRLVGARIWIHVQDFEVDAAFGMGIMRRGLASRLLLALESFLLRRFDRVSSISLRMIERLEAKGVTHDQVVLFPNWVDLKLIRPLEGGNRIRGELELDERDLVFLYSGNMGEKQGLEIIIEVARMCKEDKRLNFILVGTGAARSRIEAMSADLKNVRWLPLQPFARLNELLNLADVHLLPQKADAADLVMPSKLTGMLASGRAVIGTAEAGTQLGEVLDEVGFRVEPGDVAGFYKAIQRLAGDAALRKELGNNGRRYAEQHMDREQIMQSFIGNVVSCCR